ncbi:MAG: prepilin peptidase [Gemmatales bacterium]|nr:prepilin peptidase [Gemmatales bacterium]MDW8387421.1 prepilin peptidase [Gemmatales bacterium]
MNLIDFLVQDYPWVFLLAAFVLGAIVGSFINVCAARLPLEKGVLWPGSRCSSCLQEIRWYDNLPIISYLRLRGRCRHCDAQFSSRYFWVEFLTALGFALLLGAEVLSNLRGLTIPPGVQPGLAQKLLLMWLAHALFFSFLLTATLTDMDYREIPLPITVTGTGVGILAGLLMPWPWPTDPRVVEQSFPLWNVPLYSNMLPGSQTVVILPVAAQPWPVWLPVPDWMAPGTPLMGLITAIVGAVVGTGVMRVIRAVFSWAFDKEALGLGDADLMMMIGAFLGWQAIPFVLVTAVLAGLLYVLGVVVINPKFLRGERMFAFGPFLALGGLLTLLFFWQFVGLSWYLFEIPIQVYFFSWTVFVQFLILLSVVALVVTLTIRMVKLMAAAF